MGASGPPLVYRLRLLTAFRLCLRSLWSKTLNEDLQTTLGAADLERAARGMTAAPVKRLRATGFGTRKLDCGELFARQHGDEQINCNSVFLQ